MKKFTRPADTALYTVIKTVMTVIFLWSGALWSGIAVLQFTINSRDHLNLAVGFGISSLILLSGLILCWTRLYILQFFPCLVGLIIFLNPAREMIDHAASTAVIFKPSFEVRYLPMIAFAILSLVLLILRIYSIYSKRSDEKEKFNNLPSESILDKHRDE